MRKTKNHCARWTAIIVFLFGFVYSPFQMAMPVENNANDSWLKESEDFFINKNKKKKKKNIPYIICLAVIPREAVLLKDDYQQIVLYDYYLSCQGKEFLDKEKDKLSYELEYLTVGDIKDYLSEHIKEYLADSDKDFLSECKNKMGPRLYAADSCQTIKTYFNTLIIEHITLPLSQDNLESHIKDFMQTKTFKQNDLSQNNKMENTYFRRFFKEPNDEYMECKMSKAINDYVIDQMSFIQSSYAEKSIPGFPFIARTSIELTIDVHFNIASYLIKLIVLRAYALYNVLNSTSTEVIKPTSWWPCVIL